jgi:hypothetical protein
MTFMFVLRHHGPISSDKQGYRRQSWGLRHKPIVLVPPVSVSLFSDALRRGSLPALLVMCEDAVVRVRQVFQTADGVYALIGNKSAGI